MVTIDKKVKPKIYTESDHILNDLKEELTGLKSRMNLIEEEQEKNRHLLDQLSFQEDLANELINGQQEEIEANRENYKVIANVMHNLKSPVSNVVENLAGIISEIDDKDAQDTLKECINTASNVLNSFIEVEEFCMDIGESLHSNHQVVDIKKFFKETVSNLQKELNLAATHSMRLLIDKTIPQISPLYTETIKQCLDGLLRELNHSKPSAEISIRIASEKNEMKYGIEISDLTIQLEIDQLTDITWNESWVESIQLNQNILLNSGFNLLRIRDSLRKSGGQLEIRKRTDKIIGFKVYLPLTY
ncbi:MAG: hypothetical protein HQ517_06245 [SAR324 cluster bacterium]|nr:hypothetical protein [SAR324 cluster bacterium]